MWNSGLQYEKKKKKKKKETGSRESGSMEFAAFEGLA
jgi:hypothetical protein